MKEFLPFPENARVMMVGDSITHNGAALAYIQEYYLTHFPKKKVRFFNAGVSGGTAATSALRYLDDDLALYRPTHAVVMLGMNDSCRHLYGKEDPHTLQKADAFAAYAESMIALCDKLTAAGLPLTLCTPTPFDNGMETDTPALLGVDATLTGYGQFCRGLAEKYGASVVDYNTPLTHINRELQKKDPAASLVGADRVHPTAVGQAVMAVLFLRAQGFTDLPMPSADTAEECLAAFSLSEKNQARYDCEKICRNLRATVYLMPNVDWRASLDARRAAMERYLTDVEKGVYSPHPYIQGLARSYAENASEEEEQKRKLVRLSEALYES